MKSFKIDGAQNLEEVTQFIWRDMFLSMLVDDNHRQRNILHEMLGDIETVMGWNGLAKVWIGGSRRKSPYFVFTTLSSSVDSDLDFHDPTDETDSENEWDDILDEDNANEYGDIGWDDVVPPHYWSQKIINKLPELRHHIEQVLRVVFEANPSSEVYNALVDMSTDPDNLTQELLEVLQSLATASSDTFAVALDIYAMEGRTDLITDILDSHSHLLRPRDAHALQSAVGLMSHDGQAQRALNILQAELLDTARIIRSSLAMSFSQMDDPSNKSELSQILKLGSNTASRRNRAEAWVDAITTPGSDTPNPMMFAALVMGMPPMPGMGGDDDPYAYLDLDPHDPDLEDLRHEYRPSLKHRFESWVDIALTVKNGAPMLLVVYKHLIDTMPYLRAPDVTEEMISRFVHRIL